jgi:exopolysaccharide biosynthesis WecB/TagA/CpsF family protein
MVGVGAAFDIHSERVRQAPLWMQRNGLEWLFRLTQEPKRLWKRYLLNTRCLSSASCPVFRAEAVSAED